MLQLDEDRSTERIRGGGSQRDRYSEKEISERGSTTARATEREKQRSRECTGENRTMRTERHADRRVPNVCRAALRPLRGELNKFALKTRVCKNPSALGQW